MKTRTAFAFVLTFGIVASLAGTSSASDVILRADNRLPIITVVPPDPYITIVPPDPYITVVPPDPYMTIVPPDPYIPIIKVVPPDPYRN
ncbi:hypothetical protein DFP95_10949 [Cohnella lupini]|uniref:Uncharacterized protein n=1 Tax=Cohnella lupini TaxID=1294267 RepID=A0A3D9I8D3_9BACL|nr:hypothetical protein DFP95_10949 [Cohnella lupini]